jgi:hypothetical protein
MRLALLVLCGLWLAGCACASEQPCDAGTCIPPLVCSPQAALCRIPCNQGSDCPTNCACVLFRDGDGGTCEPTNSHGGC